MLDSLLKARDLAASVRYSGDRLEANNDGKRDDSSLKSFFSQHSVLVSPLVTPAIADSLDRVFKRLMIPPGVVHAYVYASSELQAECYAGNKQGCVIRFSSALIEILDEKEVEFVAGHEIGHFLYSHCSARMTEESSNVEYLISQRAQEISADRIGLLASESLDVSIRALMKTMSGLSSKHLRFDVAAFLSQLTNHAAPGAGATVDQSHPSMLVRCRALLWFSMNDAFKSKSNLYRQPDLVKLDKRVETDLDTFVDGPARRLIKELKDELKVWMAVSLVVADGDFDKKEQQMFRETFGDETLSKLKRFLSGMDVSDVTKAVSTRLNEANRKLREAIPGSFNIEVSHMDQEVKSRFH